MELETLIDLRNWSVGSFYLAVFWLVGLLIAVMGELLEEHLGVLNHLAAGDEFAPEVDDS